MNPASGACAHYAEDGDSFVEALEALAGLLLEMDAVGRRKLDPGLEPLGFKF